MTDGPKVISLFSREAVLPEHTGETVTAPSRAAPAVVEGICQKSVDTLNVAVEAALKGKINSVCAFGFNTETGLPTFYISFPHGKNPQLSAVHLLGALGAFKTVLEQVIFNGMDDEG